MKENTHQTVSNEPYTLESRAGGGGEGEEWNERCAMGGCGIGGLDGRTGEIDGLNWEKNRYYKMREKRRMQREGEEKKRRKDERREDEEEEGEGETRG